MIYIEFPITPVAKGRPRFIRKSGIAMTPAKTRRAESELRFWMHQKWTMELCKKPLQGAVDIIVRFIFTRPKSVSEKKRPHHTIAPDLDNLLKTVQDSGNGIIWMDDAQIVASSVFKSYGESAKICLSVKEVAS
jgi:Holliday junction resolvase RusA-like endonuclease